MPTKAKNTEKRRIPPLKIENAKIRFANFAGVAKKYNAKGLRNFHVVLDDKQANQLELDGWNIKVHEPKNEGDPKWFSLKVAVRFDHFPPRMIMVFRGIKTILDEDTVSLLDSAEIKKIDLVITASPFNVDGNSGFKAYLQKGFFTLADDDLEAQYISLPSGKGTEDIDD